MPFKRTVIGSFPSRLSELGLDGAIRWSIDLQLRYDVEVVSDGEQRGDMIEYFEQIPGLGRRFGRPAILDRIRAPSDLEDFPKLIDCRRALSYLDEVGRSDVGVKVTITGPITLGFTYAIGGLGPYRGVLDKSLYLDLAHALIPIMERAVKLGCYIQVDEPGLTGRFLPVNLAGEVLGEMFEEARLPRGSALQVCGSLRGVPGLFEMLLKLDIDVLSLAFSGEVERCNLEVVSRRALEDHGKRLGAGFVSNVVAESAEEALRRLEMIARRVGVDNIAFVHPDCGFRGTRLEVVERILEAMRDASVRFLESL